MIIDHPQLTAICATLVEAREAETSQKKIKDENQELMKALVVGEIQMPAGETVEMPGFTISSVKGNPINKDERFRKYLIDAGVDPEVINAAAVFSKGEIGEDRLTVKRGK
jgi:hypothetical protein